MYSLLSIKCDGRLVVSNKSLLSNLFQYSHVLYKTCKNETNCMRSSQFELVWQLPDRVITNHKYSYDVSNNNFLCYHIYFVTHVFGIGNAKTICVRFDSDINGKE